MNESALLFETRFGKINLVQINDLWLIGKILKKDTIS
jgi:hypothetical protein